MLRIDDLINDARCYQSVRQLRWPDGLRCVWCHSGNIRRRDIINDNASASATTAVACGSDFDDLTDTVFAHHHQPLRKWVLCLYLMGLNLSNEQIAAELDLDKDDVYQMTTQLRSGVVDLKPEPQLAGTVECDEVYIVAGHKGHPEAVKKKAAPDEAGA
ncbi:MAG TPA: transposase [Blastocatellia bacterium]|nr:transposase [Blastocatellia bacterium]